MNGRPSRASEFFRQIKEDPDQARFLKDLVSSKKPENDFLEFKGVGKITEPLIKEYWSKALSGFANTEGGVIVWGIRATKVPDPGGGPRKIDCATDLDLAPSPSGLMQLLRDIRLEATIDPVVGVDMFPVDAGAGDGSGFVVCLVPESTHKPHRAQLEGARQYWQRIGDSFVMIPHSLLRTLFYPRSQAVFRLVAELSWGLAGEGHPERGRAAVVKLDVWVANRGTGTAKDVMLRVLDNQALRSSGTWQKGAGWDHFDGGFVNHRPMHPGMPSCLACTAEWTVPATSLHSDRGKPLVPSCPDPEFRFTVFAENQRPQYFVARVSTEELVRDRVVQIEASPREPPEEAEVE